jgi:hypothetical protein
LLTLCVIQMPYFMKKLICLPLVILSFFVHAQDNIRSRIILIGDAGEYGPRQGGVITHAAAHILKNKTTVLYLGDNVYPIGMGLPGSKEEESTKKILQSQYQPMRAGGARVYFVPGNHDWDRMGPKGLAKIKRQWEYLDEQRDSLLREAPANGCPDPTEINISDNVVVIAYDSEWWLYIYNKDNPDADCDCKTNAEIIHRFDELLYKNRNKVIIIAHHHPFDSYGHHGGSYIWQDYIFPLTSVKSSLYIPLPGLGLLYPFLRSAFPIPEDHGNPLYKNMIKGINGVFDIDPNVIHVSGHEHGLQFIKNKNEIQVVSGAGAKGAVVRKGDKALFAQTVPGYVIMDEMADKSIRFTYYGKPDTTFKELFTYTKPYVPIRIPVEHYDVIKGDSITVRAHPSFDSVGKLHRLLYGENYRKEWAAATKVPVIKISTYKGGLKPVRFGGAHQTSSLLLRDADGKEYVMSSIEKYPLIVLPEAIRQTFAESWLKDAMSGQHPYGAVITSVLAEAVKVKHTSPTIGWVAPDIKLGYYEKDFAGKICLLEEREPGDSSISTGNMLRQLDKDNSIHIDSAEFFRARLLDWFLGDWDEHEDRWRWQATRRGGNKYYSAVPHDRSETFYINEGFIPEMASKPWVARYLQGYDAGPQTINGFYLNDHTLNARFLTQIGYDQWMKITRDFVAALSDDVLEQSLRHLPLAIYRISHDKLFMLMKQRRDQMIKASEIYYKFFNRRVDIKASDKSEYFTAKDTLNGGLVIRISKLPATKTRNILFTRTFDPAITKEVRLYVAKGDDSIMVDKIKSPIKLRIIGGNGHKIYNIVNADRKVNVYEKVATGLFTGNAQSRVEKHLTNDSLNVAYIPTNPYHTLIPQFKTGYDIDDGFYFDAGLRFVHNGFRKMPSYTQQLNVGHSYRNDVTHIAYNGAWIQVAGKGDIEVQADGYLPNSINFFGRGNQTSYNKNIDENYYRYRFRLINTDAYVRFQNFAGTTSIRIGPSIQYYSYIDDNRPHLVNNSLLIHTYDSTTVNKDKLHAGLVVTYIDDKRNNKLLPEWGVYVRATIKGYAGLSGYSKSFLQIIPEAILYTSVDPASKLVISERMSGGITAGKTTSYQSLFLGGETNLIGFRQDRFAGQQMMFNNLDARLKLGDLFSYILPGQFGITGFYDIGRVWVKRENSGTWHNGFGTGVYFSPSDMALLQIKEGYSSEGLYTYVNFSLTF